jgi:hypothetical protein
MNCPGNDALINHTPTSPVRRPNHDLRAGTSPIASPMTAENNGATLAMKAAALAVASASP